MDKRGFAIARTREELIDYIKLEKGIIWDSSQELYEVLDDLEDVSNNAKFKATICRNVHFSGSVKYKERDYGQILDMAEVLHDIKDDDDIIFLNNNIKEALEFIQQCININKHPNVYLKEDLYKKKVLENIDKSYRELIENSQGLIRFISNLNIRQKYRKHFDQIKNTIINIVDELKKLETKVIRVAVFASKKSGKSMVVNALLGEEYAPTSLELPTPNLVKYVPVEGIERIIVEYGANKHKFERPDDVRKWIGQKFKEVQMSGDKLENMIVNYPLKKGINYIIYDTPGPDLAGSKHDIVDEILPEVDVVIFVIDYSKYAQKDEIQLLYKLKQYFEERGKKHSFICVINKIDLMFSDPGTEKLKVRVTDFIYHKLKTLGFNEFIVIPISAMTYFYLKKLKDRFGDELVNANGIIEYLRSKGKKVEDEYTRTLIGNIQNIANHIELTYWKEDVGYQDVLHFSNFESFEKYLLNITQRKAQLEKGWDIVRKVEQYFNELTTVIRNSSQLVSSEAWKIKYELEKFLQRFDLYLTSIPKDLDVKFEEVRDKIFDLLRERILEYSYETLNATFKDGLGKLIHEKKENLKIDIKKLKERSMSIEAFRDKWSILYLDVQEEFKKSIVALEKSLRITTYDEFIEIPVKIAREEINKYFDHIQNRLEGLVDELNMGLNKIISKDLTTYKEYFKPPAVKLEFKVETFVEFLTMRILELCDLIKEVPVAIPSGIIEENIKQKERFWESLLSFLSSLLRLGGGKYRKYEVNEEALLKAIEEHLEKDYSKIVSNLSDWLKQEFSNLINKDKIEEFLSYEKDKVMDYVKSLRNPAERIKEMLEEEENERWEMYTLFKGISDNKHYESITNIWYEVYKPYREYYEQIKMSRSVEAK